MSKFEKALELYRYNKAIESAVREYMEAKATQIDNSRYFMTMPKEVPMGMVNLVNEVLGTDDKTKAIAISIEERCNLIMQIVEKEWEINRLLPKLINAYNVGEELACNYFQSEF